MLPEEHVRILNYLAYIRGRIQMARELRGWSQADAASQLGIARETLSYLESGKQRLTLEMVLRLAMVYESTVHDLIGLDRWED